MTDRPILFSGPMIRALLAGRKTQTRRILKPQPEIAALASEHLEDHELRGWECIEQADGQFAIVKRQRFQPGDRLWVRENFWQACRYPGCLPSGDVVPHAWTRGPLIQWAADGTPENTPNRHYPTGLRGKKISAPDPYSIWELRPAIHMARKLSRLTLLVGAVKVERLQDISEADAQAEGANQMALGDDLIFYDAHYGTRRTGFRSIWTTINGPKAWDANPWVVALTFGVAPANIDSIVDR